MKINEIRLNFIDFNDEAWSNLEQRAVGDGRRGRGVAAASTRDLAGTSWPARGGPIATSGPPSAPNTRGPKIHLKS